MSPLELLAPIASMAGNMPGPTLLRELVCLEILADGIARACPAAECHFHEDYAGRAILLVEHAGDCLVIAPAAAERFDLTRMVGDTMLPLAADLDGDTLLVRVLSVLGA